jgi:hypothetical protein
MNSNLAILTPAATLDEDSWDDLPPSAADHSADPG